MKKHKVKLSMILAAEQKQADREKRKEQIRRMAIRYTPTANVNPNSFCRGFEAELERQIRTQQLAITQTAREKYYPYQGIML